MKLYETVQDIEELRGICANQSGTIQELRKNLDFEIDVVRDLKEINVKLIDDVEQLKAEISWLKQMNKGLVELSMEVLRGVNNE